MNVTQPATGGAPQTLTPTCSALPFGQENSMREEVALTDLITAARGLASGDSEGAEYDRALVELIATVAGLNNSYADAPQVVTSMILGTNHVTQQLPPNGACAWLAVTLTATNNTTGLTYPCNGVLHITGIRPDGSVTRATFRPDAGGAIVDVEDPAFTYTTAVATEAFGS